MLPPLHAPGLIALLSAGVYFWACAIANRTSLPLATLLNRMVLAAAENLLS